MGSKRPEASDRRSAARRMLVHLTVAPLIKQRSRLCILLSAVAIGAAVVSALTGLYIELDNNLGREFRRFGANVVVMPTNGSAFLTAGEADAAAKAFGDKVVGYSPYRLVSAEVSGKRAVVVGLRGDQIERLHPYWKLTGGGARETRAVSGGRETFAFAGQEVARRLIVKAGDRLALSADKKVSVRLDAVIESGGPEDNQIYVDPGTAAKLAGGPERADMAYISVKGAWNEIGPTAGKAAKKLGVEIAPLKQTVAGEANVLRRVKSMFWLVCFIILATNVLCVATIMIASVMERRIEIGLKKALGADNRDILVEFLLQSAVIGLAGGLIGWALGFGIGRQIGQAVFGVPVAFHWAVLVPALAVSILTAATATIVPTRIALGIEPAVVLKGE